MTHYTDPNLQADLLELIDAAMFRGLTVAELREKMPKDHHGHISGALSLLHRDLRIARLSEKREGCKVYVHPDFLDGRKAEPQGSGNLPKDEVEELVALRDFIDYWLEEDVTGSRFVSHLSRAEKHKGLFFSRLKDLRRSQQR
jgi:hypothetical protein